MNAMTNDTTTTDFDYYRNEVVVDEYQDQVLGPVLVAIIVMAAILFAACVLCCVCCPCCRYVC